jgi:hypothetical protein
MVIGPQAEQVSPDKDVICHYYLGKIARRLRPEIIELELSC